MQNVKLSSFVSGSDFNSDELVMNLPDPCVLEVDYKLTEEKALDLEEACALSPFDIRLG